MDAKRQAARDALTGKGPFRTPSGQTGRDAYRYEAAQIRNLQRELDDRALALAAAMEEEIPPHATCTRHFGGRDHLIEREGMGRLLLWVGADECSMSTVEEIARTLVV